VGATILAYKRSLSSNSKFMLLLCTNLAALAQVWKLVADANHQPKLPAAPHRRGLIACMSLPPPSQKHDFHATPWPSHRLPPLRLKMTDLKGTHYPIPTHQYRPLRSFLRQDHGQFLSFSSLLYLPLRIVRSFFSINILPTRRKSHAFRYAGSYHSTKCKSSLPCFLSFSPLRSLLRLRLIAHSLQHA
jgi:hypothetical protein